MKSYKHLLISFFLIALFDSCFNNNNAERLLNHESLLPGIHLKLVISDLKAPVAMDAPKDGSGRIFIAQQTGKIYIIQNDKLNPDPFLNIENKLDNINKVYSEKGLLGLTFHPEYKENGRFFIYYSAPSSIKSSDHKSVIAEYKVSKKNKNQAELSEKIILEIEQPESNHNGGHLAFGSDGYLYIGTGDGGGGGDKHGKTGNAQDVNNLLGKILRIDVDNKNPYSIPAGNPFVGKGKAEIWAYGLRNPWRFSFDRKTQELYCADVGQDNYEEIDIIEKGKNYGWRIMEGNHCFNPKQNCEQQNLTAPIHEYDHNTGISITGGFVYRGKELPQLQGKYLFADWKGKLFYLTKNGTKWTKENLIVSPFKSNDIGFDINSFGEDESGELYVLIQKRTGTLAANGEIYRFTAKP